MWATKKAKITKIEGCGATFMGLGAFVGGSEEGVYQV